MKTCGVFKEIWNLKEILGGMIAYNPEINRMACMQRNLVGKLVRYFEWHNLCSDVGNCWQLTANIQPYNATKIKET